MLLAPILGGYLVRKDVMVLALYGLCLVVIQELRNKRKPGWICFFLVNSISILAILSHESYGFWAMPSLFIAVYVAHSKPNCMGTFRGVICSGFYLLPSLSSFFACLIAKGSEAQSLAIHQSWQDLDALIPSEVALTRSFPEGPIDAIGWSGSQGLYLSMSTFTHFDVGVRIPGALLLTLYLCIQLFTADNRS